MTNSIVFLRTLVIRNLEKLCLMPLLFCVLNLPQVHAGVVFTFVELGDDVVATTSGTIASGWTYNAAALDVSTIQGILDSNAIRGDSAGGRRLISVSGHWTLNNTLPGVAFYSDGFVNGDNFGFSLDNNFYVPLGTDPGLNASGGEITPNTAITWRDETFASLGLDSALSTTPLVLFTLNNGETISAVRASGAAAIPEPSSMAWMAIVIGGIYQIKNRRKGIG